MNRYVFLLSFLLLALIFPTGGHAISLRAQRGSTTSWSQLAEAWLIENGFLSPL